MMCQRCSGRGLIRVDYDSGEPFDIAICYCEIGRTFRVGGEKLVRAHLHLSDEGHVVGVLEDFAEDTPAAPMPVEELAQVGRTQKRAKL